MITDNIIQNRNFSWVDVQEPHEGDLERLHKEFNLPQLLVQDCLKPEHLPKYEMTDEGHFLMIRSFDPGSKPDSISVQDLTRKVALFISDRRLLAIHRVELPFLTRAEERMKKNGFPNSLPGLVHQILLEVIRTYEAPIDSLQDLYDEFEDAVLSKRSENMNTMQMYRFRRRVYVLKRMLKLTNDALFRFKEFWDEHPSMLQDLKENIDQLYYRLDEISDNFENLFELYIMITDQRANEIMKVLTVFSSVLLPLNFIASFYGMNFEHLPGLHSPTALLSLSIIMLLMIASAVWYFRRKGWFRTIED
jgi:magnesium transporter